MNPMDLPPTEEANSTAGWLATFADLMSLLMCFFVLLLSFSVMDAQKFKQVAESMRHAFGVQSQVPAEDLLQGTSVIAQEYSPGTPRPTPLDEVRQRAEPTQRDEQQAGAAELNDANASNDIFRQLTRDIDARGLGDVLELENLGQQIIIRIREQSSFASGSAYLQPQFLPVLKQLAGILNTVPGQLIVTGHTDDRQVHNEMFNNNLQLSASRAVAVASELLKEEKFVSSRLSVVGKADSAPLVPNSSKANRQRNRRVEIAIMQGQAQHHQLTQPITQTGNATHG